MISSARWYSLCAVCVYFLGNKTRCKHTHSPHAKFDILRTYTPYASYVPSVFLRVVNTFSRGSMYVIRHRRIFHFVCVVGVSATDRALGLPLLLGRSRLRLIARSGVRATGRHIYHNAIGINIFSNSRSSNTRRGQSLSSFRRRRSSFG